MMPRGVDASVAGMARLVYEYRSTNTEEFVSPLTERSPTAVQVVGDVHDTPFRPPSVLAAEGVFRIDQRKPSHASTSVRPV
jgi:hypothetical protein